MPTRRDFLQSALLLPAALTTTGKANAQDPPTPNTQYPTPTFDFESGNYDGWTIEGDAFGTAPATESSFPGKIRGYTGRGFLCSLHPKKGNAAIGKAISKEFTIEKPFLTFKIGGGNHPNQACLNLIVDNQVVRTATGDGTATLSESSFDVSNLLGRKAHIEIVDATASADRGYIMVDDIRFTYIKGGGQSSPRVSSLPLRNFGISPENAYTSHCDYFANGESLIMKRINKATGLSEEDFRQLQDQVWNVVSTTVTFQQGESPANLTKRLSAAVSDVIKPLPASAKSVILINWLTAEAISCWTLLNVIYDHQMAAGDTSVVYRLTATDYLMMQKPKTICGGVALFVREIGRMMGLKVYYVGGYFREIGFDIRRQNGAGHAWLRFEFGEGLMVPSDPTVAAFHRYDYLNGGEKVSGKLAPDVMLPLSVTDWEVFLGSYYPYDEADNRAGDKQCKNEFLQYSVDDWKRNTNETTRQLMMAYRLQDRKNIQR